jgi:membrane-associated phospholipid phosphatase
MEATRHALGTLRRSHPGWFELTVFLIAYATYFGVRAVTQGKVAEAVDNALDLVHVERSLDLDWEDALQGAVLGQHALVDAVNAMYIWGHWPLLIAGGVLLFRLGPAEYRRLRTVILLSGAIGLVIFALFPVAPPRLAPVGLLDTVTEHSGTYREVLPPSLVNEYAAMPSFHAGWNLLLGIELFRVGRNLLLRGFGLVMPVAMAFSVIATANHFVLDVAGGALVVIAALLLVTWIERRKVRPSRLDQDVHTVRRGPPRRQRPGHPAPRRGARAAARRG